MIAAPGAAINPTIDVGVTGLAGAGLGLTMYNASGGVQVARVTSPFTEDEAGSGFYKLTGSAYPAPSTAGNYTLEWDNAATFVAAEDLVVSYTAVSGSVAPSGADLTALATAKSWLAITDTSQDARLQQLITAASHAVMEYAQREFAPSSSAGVTRQFALKRDGLVTFGKYDLQTATSVQIDTESGGSPTTLTTDQYQLLPIDEPHGVYRMLRFYTFAIGPVLRQAFGLYRQVGVTGTWGFPSIPSDVEQATLVTVAKWFKRDEVAWSNEMPAPSLSDGLNLPFDARMLLQPYKRGA